MRLLLAIVLACLAANASALSINALHVTRDQSVFHIVVDALIDADAAAVRAQLLDSNALPQLNPNVKRVRASTEADGERVESELEECLFGVCRRLLHVQKVTTAGNEIAATTLAVAGSSFKGGSARWQLTPVAEGTRLIFTADIEPAFWLPPFIGPRLVMQQLRADTLIALQALERLAHE